MFKNAVIVSMARTAIGSFNGSLKSMSAIDMATSVTKAALEKAGVDPKTVDEVVLGCVGQYGLNVFLGRYVAVNAGCAESTAGLTVNRMCASGLQAVVNAAMSIDHGDMEIAVAGGAESMSNYPYCSYGARSGLRMGNAELSDSLMMALTEPFTGTHIAVTAENIVEKFSLTREEVDAYALSSQEKAIAAIGAGKFKDEIVPLEVKIGREMTVFDTDEHPRNTSMEKLGALKPLFKKDGVVTAGNASGINDGAAVLVLMSEEKAKALGIKPIARVVDYAAVGVDPSVMGLGPVAATNKLMEKVNMQLGDIGLFELNEAFAAQALACVRQLGINEDIVNVNGSGISLGHPIGATGAIISIKLINEMIRRNVRYGVSSLCIGGGQGLSVLFEKL